MLDKNTIAQLSQLKQDIVSSKDVAEGVVVGSNGRYGFVKLSDGRTAFLNPDKMQRVFPGDTITVDVVKNAKDQLEGEFETFVSSPLTRFVGQYKVKNGAHFVVPIDKSINRWIFLPPQNRIKCKEDDFVLAEITRHPYQDGKAAAKVITHVGTKGDNYLHHNIVIAKYGLARYWSKDAQQQAKECATAIEAYKAQDLTHIPFVTIDSASTKDMDDALFIEPHTEGGWKLWVAIADPASFITPGSFIAKSARYFGQTVYLPGRVLPMLPEGLATEAFSLQPQNTRPSLICQIHISEKGDIQSHEFSHATIISHHKLTYIGVSEYLDGDASALEPCDEIIKNSIQSLSQLAALRIEYRSKNNIIYEDQADYDWTLNKRGFIENITKRERTSAHRLVEECMVAANACAGTFLAEKKTGIFASQIGFRPERIGEVRALLREEFGESQDNTDNNFNIENINTFDGYMALIHAIKNDEQYKHLLAPLRRMSCPAELTTELHPHLGMGFKHYAPITSPIRRYADVCNHWAIKQLVQKNKTQNLPPKLIEQLVATLDNARKANRELEQILMCDYLSQHIGDTGEGTVRIVTQQGFGVRMNETGMEGFIQIPKNTQKAFDAKRMTLSIGEHTFALDTTVNVKVTAVDSEKRRVKFELADIDLSSFKSDDSAPTQKEKGKKESASKTDTVEETKTEETKEAQ